MKLTIDTKDDSHEDIRKVIKMLQHLVGEQPHTNQPNMFEDSVEGSANTAEQPAGGNAFAAMFGSASEQKEEPASRRRKADELPRIVPY